jgi:hypothetical protein
LPEASSNSGRLVAFPDMGDHPGPGREPMASRGPPGLLHVLRDQYSTGQVIILQIVCLQRLCLCISQTRDLGQA